MVGMFNGTMGDNALFSSDIVDVVVMLSFLKVVAFCPDCERESEYSM